MELLIASVVVLCAGPVFYELLARRQSIMALLDGFVLMSVIGLVVMHLLPEALIAGGIPAAIAGVIGFALPILLDRVLHRASERPHGHGGRPHSGFLWAVIIGLALHAALDGAALSPGGGGHDHGGGGGGGDDHGDELLGIAVLLHRLPLGLIIWWLARPAWGTRLAVSVLVLMGIATIGGYFGAGHVLAALPGNPVPVFEALIAGGLFHVAFHHPPMLDRRHPQAQMLGGVGGVVALAFVGGIAATHPIKANTAGSMPFSDTLHALILSSAPALLAAFGLAALIQAFVRSPSSSTLGHGASVTQAIRGVFHGLRLPISACGVLPLYQSLRGFGVPATSALAALVATPAIGLDALAISLPLLGWELTLTRALIAVLVAVLVGALLGRRWADAPNSETIESEVAAQSPRGLMHGFRYGFGELVDHSVPWLFVGFIVAAFVEAVVPAQALSAAAPWDVVIFAVLGIPLFLSAVGTTPLAALLVLKGVSPGAALAFLIVGPVVNIPTLGVLRDEHGEDAGRRFTVTVVVAAVVIGYAVNGIFSDVPVPTVASEHTAVHAVCVWILAALFAVSLVRRGPRYLIEGMIPHVHALDEDDGHHDHHHDHPHEHHHAH